MAASMDSCGCYGYHCATEMTASKGNSGYNGYYCATGMIASIGNSRGDGQHQTSVKWQVMKTKVVDEGIELPVKMNGV